MKLNLLCLAAGLGLIVFSQGGSSGVEKSTLLATPPDQMKYFAFGYNENIADSLWIRVIQDFDVCQTKGDTRVLRAGAEHRQGTALPKAIEGRVPFCQKGWVYRMLVATTEVAPRFRGPYDYGAINLSVVVDDIAGATDLFERGLKVINDDWYFEYKAAYHFLIELKDPKRASELLVSSGKKGAPPWVFNLAAKLMTREGQVVMAKSVLEEQIRQQDNEKIREMLQARLREIEEGKITADPAATTPPATSSQSTRGS